MTFRNLSAPALASFVPSGLNRRPKTVSEWSAVERPDEQPLADLPELDLARPRRLAAAGRQQLAVGAEVERQDAEGVRAERLHLRPRPLERPALSVLSAEAETSDAVGREGDRLDRLDRPVVRARCGRRRSRPGPSPPPRPSRRPRPPAVASRSPVGLKATELTGPGWPASVGLTAPVAEVEQPRPSCRPSR